MLTIKKTNKPLATVLNGKEKGTIVYYEEKNLDAISTLLQKKIDRELITTTGNFFPIPISGTLGDRQCIYVIGKSGAGKSTWLSEYAKLYKKMYPDNNIFLFSNKPEDIVFKDLEPKRIQLNIESLDAVLKNFDKINNCLIIFDDVDSFEDKEVEKLVIEIQNKIYMLGRSNKISLLHSKHLGLDYQKSRVALNEMTGCVFFLKATNPHIMRSLMKTYVGLDKNQIEMVLKLNSRWCYINSTFPSYLISEKKICLL